MTDEAGELNPQAPSLVEEGLIVGTKDERYKEQCQEILQQLLEAFGASNEVLAKHWSSLLFTLLVLWPQRQTLGMQVLGLKHSHGHGRLVAISVASSLLVTALHALSQRLNQSADALHGTSRRAYFAQQRQAMLDRANNLRQGPLESSDFSSRDSQSATFRWKSACKSTAQWLSNAVKTLDEGPHAVEANSRSALQWLLRLHLGLYCLDGQYASVQHRMLGITYQQHQENTKLVNRPTTTRVIGGTILAHVLGMGLIATSKKFVQWSVATLSKIQFRSSRISTSSLRQTIPTSPTVSCTICHGERKHPSCPVTCGHVFCWTCLQKWVKHVRPECPMCRAPCTPQQVIPLLNYRPTR